jgi:hypothetical protein
MTAIVSAFVPGVAVAQLTNARPASVSLTVVVPPRPDVFVPVVAAQPLRVEPAGVNAIDLETAITIGDRVPSRVEVSLGRGWSGDATRLWVRNARGGLERLAADDRVVAFDGMIAPATPPSVRFRVESNQRSSSPAFDLPVEYRVRVGTGDTVSTWTFTSSLRVDVER